MVRSTRPSNPAPEGLEQSLADGEEASGEEEKRLSSKSQEAKEELFVRRWLRARGYYRGDANQATSNFFFHIVSCLKQPRGRADGASTGSQTCYFSYEVDTASVVDIILEGWQGARRSGYKYDVQNQTWFEAPGTTTYYEESNAAMTEFLNLAERFPTMEGVCGASKLAPPPQGYLHSKVVVRAVTPLIVEVVKRSYGRIVMETTFNVITVNDENGILMPPDFHYAPGMRECVRARSTPASLPVYTPQHPQRNAPGWIRSRV